MAPRQASELTRQRSCIAIRSAAMYPKRCTLIEVSISLLLALGEYSWSAGARIVCQWQRAFPRAGCARRKGQVLSCRRAAMMSRDTSVVVGGTVRHRHPPALHNSGLASYTRSPRPPSTTRTHGDGWKADQMALKLAWQPRGRCIHNRKESCGSSCSHHASHKLPCCSPCGSQDV